MSNPRFSIVIPTRNRAKTLKHTIRTCLMQSHESFEIVVSDNCSTSETKRVVDSFGSNKIRYFRSNIPLAMSDNWEFAVSHAKGEYIIVIGDDDGLLLHALNDIDNLIRELRVNILRWERVYYSWPSHPTHPNLLRIPLNRENKYIDSYNALRRSGNNQMDYRLLPMFYNSAVHRDLLAELKQKTGRVFVTIAPDISSGFGFASLVKEYPSVGRPMTINGGSAKSNGVATLAIKGQSSIVREFQSLNSRSQLRWHSKVPQLLSLSALLADAFLQTKELILPYDSKLKVDRRRLVLNCLHESRSEFYNSDVQDLVLRYIRRSLEDDNEMVRWFDANIVNSELTRPDHEPVNLKYGFTDQNLFLRADEFGVRNVHGVSVLYEKLTSCSQSKISWRQPERSLQWYYQKLCKVVNILPIGK